MTESDRLFIGRVVSQVGAFTRFLQCDDLFVLDVENEKSEAFLLLDLVEMKFDLLGDGDAGRLKKYTRKVRMK